MSDPDDFGDLSYSRLKKWQHSPRVLIRQSVRYGLRYFGASEIECDLRDQNIINEAVKNLCFTRKMKVGTKLNIKKLPKLDLEINYNKLIVHTHPPTTLDLSQILFCEKSKLSSDNQSFQYLAFVANIEAQNMAFIFVCSNELALEISRTYTQLFDMNIMHTNCLEIRNALRRVGCGTETSKQVQDLWKNRDDMFKDAVYKIQSNLTKHLPLLDESLEKLVKTNVDKDVLTEHTKLVNELKQSLIQATRYAQGVSVDSSVLMSQQLETCLNPRPPVIKAPISPVQSKDADFHNMFSTPKSISINETANLSNTYETPRISSPRSPQSVTRPELPNTPIPSVPVAFRTLPTRSPARKKSPAKGLFNTLKPKPRTKFATPTNDETVIKELNNLFSSKNGKVGSNTNNRPPNSPVSTFILEKDSNNQPSTSSHESNYYGGTFNAVQSNTIQNESTYYEGPLSQQPSTSTDTSPYYEGTLKAANNQQQKSSEDYYYCPMPVGGTPKRSSSDADNLPTIRISTENAEGSESQSESSASQRNSIRESNAFEDEDPESVYILGPDCP